MRSLNRLQSALLVSVGQSESRSLSVYPFKHLSRVTGELERRFASYDQAIVDPYERRVKSVMDYLAGRAMTPRSWRAVFSSLCDVSVEDVTAGHSLIDLEMLLIGVIARAKGLINEKRLTKADWSALCYSYFSFNGQGLQARKNFLELRQLIVDGFDFLHSLERNKAKQWVAVVAEYRSVFTDSPVARLSKELMQGEIVNLSLLNVVAQVPDHSWLWQRIFQTICQTINEQPDAEFLAGYLGLLERLRQHEMYYDDVLASCLTRYHRLAQSRKVCPHLKLQSYERWGSPQLKTKQVRWLQYVQQPVLDMVCAWFAEEDLKDFFNLLKGDAEVDEARLFYWLRFTGQMKYTRIILGRSAQYSTDPDFVEFRKRNKGRLSELKGSTAKNNAVVMQIGDCYFVEFSQTGHACYAYESKKLPFDPEKIVLDLSLDLKVKKSAMWKKDHSPRPYSPSVLDGWLLTYDALLAEQGIYSDDYLHRHTDKHTSTMHQPAIVRYGAGSALPSSNQLSDTSLNNHDLSVLVRDKLGKDGYVCIDHRNKGGAYNVYLEHKDYEKITQLKRLGFQQVKDNPLRFWKK